MNGLKLESGISDFSASRSLSCSIVVEGAGGLSRSASPSVTISLLCNGVGFVVDGFTTSNLVVLRPSFGCHPFGTIGGG